eukprot:95397_1
MSKFYWRFQLLKSLKQTPIQAPLPLPHASSIIPDRKDKPIPNILEEHDVQLLTLAMVNSGDASEILRIICGLVVSRPHVHRYVWATILSMLADRLMNLGYLEHASAMCSALYSWESYFMFVPNGRSPGDAEQSIRMTAEQNKVVNCPVEKGDVIKVLAFAGSGKTTTALHFIANYLAKSPRSRVLYLTFSRALREDTAARLSAMGLDNADARTLHSLTRDPYGKKHSDRTGISFGDPNPADIVEIFGWPEERKYRHKMALCVRDTLKSFFWSAAPKITLSHVPTWKIDNTIIKSGSGKVFTSAECLVCAKDLWEIMKDSYNRKVRITFDGYQKLYQMNKTIVDDSYDVVVVDEAQDLSRCQAAIVMRMPAAKLLIGDNHQEIYRWRGSFGFLESVPATKTFCLPHSWRFGRSGAQVLNAIIGLKQRIFQPNSPHLTSRNILTDSCHVIGDVRKDDRYFNTMDDLGELFTPGFSRFEEPPPNSSPWQSSRSPTFQICVITRSNSHMFFEAVRAASKDKSIAFHSKSFNCDGLKYRVNQIKSVYKLYFEKAIILNNVPWKSFNELSEFAVASEDTTLQSSIEVVEKFKEDTLQNLELIKTKMLQGGDIRKADVILTTAHGAKGCEWDCVLVADDFISGPQIEEKIENMMLTGYADKYFKESLNLLYVAASRARTKLIMSKSLRYVLQRSWPKCLVLRDEMIGPETECGWCEGIIGTNDANEISRRSVVMEASFFGSKKFLCNPHCQDDFSVPFSIDTQLSPDTDDRVVNTQTARELLESPDSLTSKLDVGHLIRPLLGN